MGALRKGQSVRFLVPIRHPPSPIPYSPALFALQSKLVASQEIFIRNQKEITQAEAAIQSLSDQLSPPPAPPMPFFEDSNGCKRGNVVFLRGNIPGSEVLASVLFRFGAKHGRRFLISPAPFDPRNSHMSFQPHDTHLTTPELLYHYRNLIPNPQFVSFTSKPPDGGNGLGWQLGVHTREALEAFWGAQGAHQQVLMLIGERFDESLVLMKRRLGWNSEDILYLSGDFCPHGPICPLILTGEEPEAYSPTMRLYLKSRHGMLLMETERDTDPGTNSEPVHNGASGSSQNSRMRAKMMKNRYVPASNDTRPLPEIDATLYGFYLKNLESEIEQGGPGFKRELEQFKKWKQELKDQCLKLNRGRSLHGKPSHCAQYLANESEIIERIISHQGVANRLLPFPKVLLVEDELS